MLQQLQRSKHFLTEYKNDEEYFLQLSTLFMQKAKGFFIFSISVYCGLSNAYIW